MSESAPAPQETSANENDQQQQVPQNVDPFTVLFNAVEIANRRGAYSLRESGVISRALDIVRANVQVVPTTDQVSETPATAENEAKEEEPTIEATTA